MSDNEQLKEKLINAIEINDIVNVKILLEMGIKNNNEYDNSFLNKAAEKGYLEIYKLLIAYGGSDENEEYLSAISNGHINIAKYLIEVVAEREINLEALVSVAISNNQTEIVKLCLENFDSSLINEKQWLQLACDYSSIDIIELLVNNNDELTYQFNELLEEALQGRNLKVIRYLIENSVNIKDEKEKILSYSIDDNNQEMIELLISRGANIKEVINKCYMGNFREINEQTLQLLETYEDMNIPIESKIHNHKYYLQIFAYSKNFEAVKYLIKKSPSQEAKNLAMIASILSFDQKMLTYLIQNGADIHYNNDQILLEAIKKNSPQLARSLMKMGCDYKKNEKDIIFHLIVDGNTEMLEELINQGANISDKENNYLASATFNNKFKVTKLLVEKGVGVNIDNHLAFDGALSSKNIELIQFIIKQYQNKKKLIDYIDNIIVAKTKMSDMDANSDLTPSDQILEEVKVYLNYAILSEDLIKNKSVEKKNKL